MENLNLKPAQLLVEHVELFTKGLLPGPILDLACGDCRNGIYLAKHRLPVVCCDRSPETLNHARDLATDHHVNVECWEKDLELEGVNPLPEEFYGGVLVFRYLHRPLLDCIKKSLKQGGLLVYETFTHEQPRFGKPHNPNYLLRAGELLQWFDGWEIIHYFEGIQKNPLRAVAQIVCRKQGCVTNEGKDVP
jgi:tellurite methyltransferase